MQKPQANSKGREGLSAIHVLVVYCIFVWVYATLAADNTDDFLLYIQILSAPFFAYVVLRFIANWIVWHTKSILFTRKKEGEYLQEAIPLDEQLGEVHDISIIPHSVNINKDVITEPGKLSQANSKKNSLSGTQKTWIWIVLLFNLGIIILSLQSPPPHQVSYSNEIIETITEGPTKVVQNEPEKTESSTLNDLKRKASTLGSNASAMDYAELLDAISNMASQDDKDQHENIALLESDLVEKLRLAVKKEIVQYHSLALKAAKYSNALEYYRAAQEKLSIYPISNEQSVIREAEQLSLQHQDVRNRIEQLRRQRYNYWASQQIKSSLDVIKKRDAAIKNEFLSEINNVDYKKFFSYFKQLSPIATPYNGLLAGLTEFFNGYGDSSDSEKNELVFAMTASLVSNAPGIGALMVPGTTKEAVSIYERVASKKVELLTSSIDLIKIIEPALLDPATASLYQVAVSQLMDDIGKDKRADIAIMMASLTTSRRLLEDF